MTTPTTPRVEIARLGDCEFCAAAYPELMDDETLTHSADPRMGDLARAFAMTFQHDEPSTEQIGWFCQDADAVIDDFPDAASWTINDHDDSPTDPGDPQSRWYGVEHTFNLNGVAYIVQASEWEPSHPIKRETYIKHTTEESWPLT